MTSDDLIDWLQRWYAVRCDGEWEHTYGVTVDTLDNPGWSVRIDVGGDLADFSRVDWQDGDEWMTIWLEAGQLNAVCGPRSLRRVLALIRETLDA